MQQLRSLLWTNTWDSNTPMRDHSCVEPVASALTLPRPWRDTRDLTRTSSLTSVRYAVTSMLTRRGWEITCTYTLMRNHSVVNCVATPAGEKTILFNTSRNNMVTPRRRRVKMLWSTQKTSQTIWTNQIWSLLNPPAPYLVPMFLLLLSSPQLTWFIVMSWVMNQRLLQQLLLTLMT